MGTVPSTFLRWMTSLCPGWNWSMTRRSCSFSGVQVLFPAASCLFPGLRAQIVSPCSPSCFPLIPLDCFPRCPGCFLLAFKDRFPSVSQVVSFYAFPLFVGFITRRSCFPNIGNLQQTRGVYRTFQIYLNMMSANNVFRAIFYNFFVLN